MRRGEHTRPAVRNGTFCARQCVLCVVRFTDADTGATRRSRPPRRLVQGEPPDTIDEWFEMYAPLLVRFLTVQNGGDRSSAEDAVATAFVRLLTYGPETLSRIRKPVPYLRRAVSNELATMARRTRARPVTDFELERSSPTVDEPAAAVTNQIEVGDALKSLPKHQLDVVLLFVYESKTEHEIAKILRVPIGTVKSRKARAFSHLRYQIERGAEDGPTIRP